MHASVLQVKADRWEFVIDIAAPQFIVPENFTDSNSTMVVVDLGHLTLNNVPGSVADERPRRDTNEDDNGRCPSMVTHPPMVYSAFVAQIYNMHIVCFGII